MSRRLPARLAERAREDRGYVIVLTALLILPLMAFAGFATDIGAWYAQASRLQRTADAAALAGVVHLPDLRGARNAAEDVAERNGYVDGVDDIDIEVRRIGTDRLNVVITDESADLFFASLVIQRIEIERSATAEWIAPLSMGSPDNAFGNEGLADYPGRPNYFGAVSGRYTDRRQGDHISTRCDESRAWNWCRSRNPTYDPTGYYYAVEIPPGASGVDIEIFDAGFADRGNPTVETGDFTYGVPPSSENGVSTRYQLYNTDLTPQTHLDNPEMRGGDCQVGPGRLSISATSPMGINGWTTLCRLTAPTPGIYPLQIRSYSRGYATNSFSIRATSVTAVEPRVYGIGKMSIFAEADAGTTEFFLADIPETHAGQRLEIDLFDPGESTGQANLEIQGPAGTSVTCTISVDGGAPTTYSPCSIQTADPSGNALFNGRMLTIQVDLDPGYSCAPDCWWRVKYDFAAKAHDRTVWSARILGDPVRLVRTGE